MSSQPLTAAMDNVLAWRLGRAANAAAADSAGDLIDRGLSLRRHLENEGFAVIELPKQRG